MDFFNNNSATFSRFELTVCTKGWLLRDRKKTEGLRLQLKVLRIRRMIKKREIAIIEDGAKNGIKKRIFILWKTMNISNNPVKGFLLDITGVLYNSDPNTIGRVIQGSVEAVN
ncbi:hypothetical protein LOAG_12622, partial [Loa loa]